MKRVVGTALVAGFALLLTAGSLSGHHSFAGVFDGGRVINLKGVITRFELLNPHSMMFVETKGAGGEIQHWVLEGPAVGQLDRRGINKDSFKTGVTIEACGYQTKDGVASVYTAAEPISLSLKANPRPSGRLISAELLTLASGEKVVWSNYGQKKCLDPQ
jgi:hypothetical protein